MKIPGFIDLQVNGYQGVDFSNKSLNIDDCAKACKKLLDHGTAAFLATLVTSDEKCYRQNLPILAELIADSAFKDKILGIHAEGPFISKLSGAVGAHNSTWVKKPSLKFFEKMQKWAKGNIRLVTLAAELPGAVEFTKEMVRQHVTVSLGHQMAGYDDMSRLADAGAKCITHLGNGMPNMVHRHNNPLLAGLAEDRLAALIITDSHHLPDGVVKTIIKVKSAENIIVTSDASPIAGFKPGRYDVMGNTAILTENGLLHNPKKKCLVGSSFTMLECMNHLLKLNLLNEEQLFKVSFLNPLKLINIRSKNIKSINIVKLDKKRNQFVIIRKNED